MADPTSALNSATTDITSPDSLEILLPSECIQTTPQNPSTLPTAPSPNCTKRWRDTTSSSNTISIVSNCSEYSPHSEGHAALAYMPFIEITRKIVLAVKVAQVPYFIMVGGTGSLYVPGEDHVVAGEHGHFWRAFRQAMADSESAVQYMEERLGPLGIGL